MSLRSAMRRLSYLLLATITLFKLQVFGTVLLIARKYYQYSMIAWIYQNPNDPEVIIKIDVSNAFNSTDRPFTLDCISGRASRDYACGLKRGDVIGTVDSLTNLFGYFKAMRTCHSKLRCVYVLLPLENLLWAKLRDYAISRANNILTGMARFT